MFLYHNKQTGDDQILRIKHRTKENINNSIVYYKKPNKKIQT